MTLPYFTFLTQLFQPSACTTAGPTELSTPHDAAQLKPPSPSCSRELTAVEFAFSISPYTICSVLPKRRAELNDYLSTILHLALRFSSTGFYTYHVLLASASSTSTRRGALLACDLAATFLWYHHNLRQVLSKSGDFSPTILWLLLPHPHTEYQTTSSQFIQRAYSHLVQ